MKSDNKIKDDMIIRKKQNNKTQKNESSGNGGSFKNEAFGLP